mmetsp:Transcript_17486/g.56734  ORF Transcript_17486/g.56734 Transcript_17486/m.56734 type:complete len:201 (+) Transcript_17486:1808-2410(+)
MPRQFEATPSSSGSRRSAKEATHLMFCKSTSSCSLTPSRWILTTTSLPESLNLARCTCAKLAAAKGVRSKRENTCATSSTSNSSLTIATARSTEKPGTAFCNDTSSSITSRGNTSTLVDNNCPNLINVGPKVTRASFSSDASFRRAATAPKERLDDGYLALQCQNLKPNFAARSQIRKLRDTNRRCFRKSRLRRTCAWGI